MRGRIGFAWALAAGVILAFLLVSACQPGYRATAATGMSAPLIPAASIESAPALQLPQLQFDWYGLAIHAFGSPLTLAAMGANGHPRQYAGTDPPLYGPLHRRPPPSFS